ncbi:MAG: bifunctional aspartate kinase/homoserine dehydrogenase I [Lysobacterales bacterium]
MNPPRSPLRLVAHKFGGSSMRDAARIRAVAEILLSRPEPAQVVVVSAMQGVTDALIELVAAAARREPGWREQLRGLQQRHLDAAAGLLDGELSGFANWLAAEFANVADVLHALALMGTSSREALELLQGMGEVWSSRLLAAHLLARGQVAEWLDAREVLSVRSEELGVMVDWPRSQAAFAAWREQHPATRIIATGYVARDQQGRATTLGRNGSDYSGSIFGALAGADEIHIWTDVDGVLSADPRRVPEAVLVPDLSFDEACELAYFGAKVIHPQTMAPAIARGIPITIRNTFRPELPGSRIGSERSATTPVKGVSVIDGLALINVEGAGMIGVPGTAERLFGALRQAGISVVMISQGSSEHSICCVVREPDSARAGAVLNETFARELDRGFLQAISVEPGISVLAIVGDGMAGTPGVAARLFEHLARGLVNVRAIAQGASERNISVAIRGDDATKALRVVHAGFYLSAQTLSIGIIGPGHVGAALIDQIAAAQARLRREAGLDLRVRAIAGSRRLLAAETGIDLADWRAQYAQTADAGPVDLHALAEFVHAAHLPHAMIIDCSASDAVAECYPDWLAAGIHVITPNKHAGAGPLARYRAIQQATQSGQARFRYEATVGAGLPVISTLRDLIDTGDRVIHVQGMFSGTLAFLFNRFDGSQPFSELVREARQRGYTEPDPRDDLDGRDVARKLVILARELGLGIELADVTVDSLIPSELRAGSAEDFMAGAAALDRPMQQRLDAARGEGQVLRFVASLDASGAASVGLVALPRAHAFANARLTDNVVQFTTARYAENPLVVQGPGAGPEVTAAGVFADLLRVAAYLGARL